MRKNKFQLSILRLAVDSLPIIIYVEKGKEKDRVNDWILCKAIWNLIQRRERLN